MEVYMILVVLLSLCSRSFCRDCNRELQENIDYPGTDITFLYSPDVAHCQQLCTQHPSCLFFTFIRADWTRDNRHFYCYLKSTPSGQPNVRTPLPGVTSGFSLKPCNPDPQPCLSELYQNVDFYGADYKTFFTSGYEECQRACTQDPSCQFFTFVNGDFAQREIRYKCHLKFSWAIPRTPIVEGTTGVISGFSHKVQMTQSFDRACRSKLLQSTNIPGNNFETLPAASPDHCQVLCSAHPRCTYFSYNSKAFSCSLKNNPNQMVTESKDEHVSGMPARFCQLDTNWTKVAFEGLDFRASDLQYEVMGDAESCQKKCTADPQCQFYTYCTDDFAHTAYRGRCYLKRVITMPAPPKVAKLTNVVSGFSLNNCAHKDCNRELLEDIDFPGTDITFVYSPDAQHCQQLCTQHSSCLFFTFIRPDWTRDGRHFYCYLKRTASGQPNVQTRLLGVTSGFSLKACSPDPHPCLSQVYENVDFYGADYKTLFTPDSEECQRACTQDPSCQFFTFVQKEFRPEDIRYKCHLKFSWSVPRTPIVEKRAGLISGFSHAAPMTQISDTACQNTFLQSTNIPGHDIETLPAATAEHCQVLCSAHPRCTYFSYNSNALSCSLKNNPNELKSQVRTGFTSGMPARFCQLDTNWLKVPLQGIDFLASDIRFELMDDAETCQKTCTADPNCQFYTYATENFVGRNHWRRCYLKRVTTMPAPPKVSKLPNVVSGFSLRACGPSFSASEHSGV